MIKNYTGFIIFRIYSL